MSQPHDFPFDITDVAELLHLRILPCAETVTADVFLQGSNAVSIKALSERFVGANGSVPQYRTESDCDLPRCAKSLGAEKEA